MTSMDLHQLAFGLRDVLLVALLVVTSWTDTRTARVRNVHTFPAMALGLLLSALAGGMDGAVASLLGILAGLVIMFPLFALNLMRAGDAKLLMAIGALAGAGVALRALLISCFLFIPVALVILVMRGRMGGVWEALKRFGRFFYTTLHPLLKSERLGTDDAVMTPFALVLSLAALIAWKTQFLVLDL